VRKAKEGYTADARFKIVLGSGDDVRLLTFNNGPPNLYGYSPLQYLVLSEFVS